MLEKKLKEMIVKLVFSFRPLLLVMFVLTSLFLAYQATHLKVDAGYEKMLPLKHPYIQTLLDYRDEFGGGNRIIIALIQKEGDIFTPEYFDTLKDVTDGVFFLNGINKARVTSLFTPNVRFTEVVEDGFNGGPVIPSRFNTSNEMLEQVRQNIIKSGQLGRLVVQDFSGTLITAELLDRDPETGEKIDYQAVAAALEKDIREKYQTQQLDVHIIGFAKVVGDISDGVKSVVLYFGLAFVITGLLLFGYSGSLRLTVLPLFCSTIAVVWQIGLLTFLGYGIDPMSILVPFLVFAIGVSHGVQMISGWMGEVLYGGDTDEGHAFVAINDATSGIGSMDAAKRTFARLIIPGTLALASDTIGFLTVMLIDIGIIREMAITASIGVAVIILTNLILLPVLLSYTQIKNIDSYRQSRRIAEDKRDKLWHWLAKFTRPRWSIATLIVTALLLGAGYWKSQDLKIGDLQQGVPELHEDSRYNLDTRAITDNFEIGVDVLSIIVSTEQDGCINYEVMDAIDRFSWYARNLPGVQSVISLPVAAKQINAAYNEGSPKWQVLSRNRYVISQSISPITTKTGLLNAVCDAMPVLIFTRNHQAETVESIMAAIKEFDSGLSEEKFKLNLASGNVGVIAATNEAVEEAQLPIMLYVYVAIFLLCLITFRSVRGTLCIILPLGLVSILCYALMAVMDIGLKVSTLPVAALGVGIGVDYGIYIYSRLNGLLKQGLPLEEAYYQAMRLTGKPVIFTGLTLAAGVFTWLFSALKFQADMGVLLTFMFLINMVGAIIVLPALACWILPKNKQEV